MGAALFLVLLLSSTPQQIVDDPVRAGWEAIQTGDGERAAAAFRRALAVNPRDARTLVGAGIAAHLIGRDDDAISSLKRALDVQPDYAYAAYILGQVAYERGDLDLAIRSFETVVKVSPGNRDIYNQLQQWKKEAALHASFNERQDARFRILFEGPEQRAIADRVAATLETAYRRVGKALNAYPPETITAILYTREQFRDITRSPGWAGGAYDGRIRIPVKGALNSVADLDRIVTHEFVHAAIQTLAPRGVPTWLNEGLASYFEPGQAAWLTRSLRTSSRLIPLSELEEGFGRYDGDEALLAYAESVVAARVLLERLGPNFPVFLQYVGNGTSVEQSLLLFNLTYADIERAWAQRARGK
jgi:tetratricopeptide (TPR) repeat protein